MLEMTASPMISAESSWVFDGLSISYRYLVYKHESPNAISVENVVTNLQATCSRLDKDREYWQENNLETAPGNELEATS